MAKEVVTKKVYGFKELKAFSDEFNREALTQAVEEGADINVRDNSTGQSLLISICAENKFSMADFLLVSSIIKPKLDASLVDIMGKTALMYAIENNPEVAKLLVQNIPSKIGLGAEDNDGKSAFDYAQGNVMILELLNDYNQSDNSNDAINISGAELAEFGGSN